MIQVYSPHLDDAVLSIGQTLANLDACLITMLADLPVGAILTAYDQNTGFGSSIEAITRRRLENKAAATVLDISTSDAPFRDQQYGDPAETDHMVEWVQRRFEIDRPTATFAPLGIAHPDHVRVADAVRIAWLESGTGKLYLYEELPYRVQFPDIAVDRARTIGQMFLDETYKPGPLELKRAAVECYRSQITDDMRRMVYVPERVWRFDRE